MVKKVFLAVSSLLLGVSLLAQVTGGVKGTIVSRVDRSPVSGAVLKLTGGTEFVSETVSAQDGTFFFGDLPDGIYNLTIAHDEFLETQVNVTVNDGFVKNLFNLSLSPRSVGQELDMSNFAEFDLEDSGYSDNPTLLFSQNDVFSSMAGFNFSSVRFKTRGYGSESQDVYLAGVRMNDAITDYSPFSLWSGLNEATRTKDATIGLESSRYGFGGINGITNIPANASSMRVGLRGSVLTNSAMYRLRVMLSYGSGKLDNGWAYAFNISTRLGGNDWIQGVYYKSFAYYGAVEKFWGDAHRLGFVFMASPGERGAQNSSTQEVYDLVGDNMYNSNWGWYNGQIRNARVRKTHEPIAILKYDFTPSDRFQLAATVLYRFGKNGYTALDWYDAADPRPDYYRNLPSYFYNEDPDYDRTDMRKAAWAREAWVNDYTQMTHVNWDRLYNVNRQSLNEFGYARSKYVQEERHVDQQDLNFALSTQWKPARWYELDAGLSAKVNRTENYKKIADLLGGDYFVDLDNFAERDFASNRARVQNDLDYYFMAGAARVLYKGDKYGYDYLAHVHKYNAWVDNHFKGRVLSGNLAASVGNHTLWREGLVRKGLFAGLDEGGNLIYDEDGNLLTSYDSYGEVITSKGNSKKAHFLTWAVKGGLELVLSNRMRLYGNMGYFHDAPTFNQSFLSPRTRNSLIPDLTTIKTFSTDVNFQYSYGGVNARVTAFYTNIMDQSTMRSYYNDLQGSFVNAAMSGINEIHKGIELGVKMPTPVTNLALQGVLSWGEYYYSSNPYMTMTVDNSSELVTDHQIVPYWMSHPVFKRDPSGRILSEIDHYQKHYVPSTPQLAASLGLTYNKNYWFIDADVDYFAHSYLEMSPLSRTDMATAGGDGVITPVEVEAMGSQEMFDPAFLVNCSVGKSWYRGGNQIGFSLQVKNLLNNRGVKTGGYEQTRLIDDTKSGERYYPFDPKYFYMSGINYMLNIYFRF
ncbi:MAG: carboxypeptidase regulatory-like domain-containing protein [Bacteroidales bacterium]|nr:carboxypeptidase regulatory-like domain-containing protein [Bacteroidales bacterium]